MSEADIHEHINRLYAEAKQKRAAQGIEAASAAETTKIGSVHESPVAKPCAQASEPSERGK